MGAAAVIRHRDFEALRAEVDRLLQDMARLKKE